MDRFGRQRILPGIGDQGQTKLADAKVLVVGAGGLGCPALLYLAAAGVGRIGIVDGDIVSISNLNRQVLFGESALGLNKAEVAAHILTTKYSDIRVDPIPEFLRVENAWMILSPYDLVVDGSDNFPTRYLVNDACVLLGKPIVFGAIFQNQGQVGILNAKGTKSVNYRDIYPEPPSAMEVPNCNETGVVGALPGIIGTMQAAEAIKWITGIGKPLIDCLSFYDLMNQRIDQFSLQKSDQSEKTRPKNRKELEAMDYPAACGDTGSVGWQEALKLFQSSDDAVLVDVREPDEVPRLEHFPYLSLPYSQLEKRKNEIMDSNLVLLFCQSGIRSQKAMQELQRDFPGKRFFTISGGMLTFDISTQTK